MSGLRRLKRVAARGQYATSSLRLDQPRSVETETPAVHNLLEHRYYPW